jgi:hypothetical protein
MLLSFLFSLILGLESLFAPKPQINAETYHILFIQGTIQNKNTGATLKRGDKLTATDKVVFKSKDAKAVVLSTTRGRFVLASKAGGSSELADFVSNVVSPLKTNSKLSTRGGDYNNGIQDFKAHFGKINGDNIPAFAIIGDEYLFPVDKSKYRMDAEQILSIYYHSNSGKKILKAIGFTGNIANINKQAHFLSKGVDPSDVNYIEIKPYDRKNNKPMEDVYASFKPIFINSDELKASFQEYLTMTESLDVALKSYMSEDAEAEKKIAAMDEKTKKRELLYFFIQECYGQHSEEGSVDVNKIKVDEPVLEKWLKTNGFIS